MFYIRKVVENGWSRPVLNANIDANLFQNQGSAITNFDTTLPISQSESAKELLKKEYDLSFITVEEVKKEKDLENALANNITRFLLELGRGFSYVGRQMELQMPGGQTFFPDLVFYHIPQHRYVVVELKAVNFIPEFAGKLNFYVTAADKLLRGEGGQSFCRLAYMQIHRQNHCRMVVTGYSKAIGRCFLPVTRSCRTHYC